MTQDNQENFRKTQSNFAIKIQKIFRGYLYRKNNRLNSNNKKDNKIANNIGIYIRKKIICSKKRLNTNLNNTENNLIKYSFLKDRNNFNLNNSKIKLDNTNIMNENKIQEIILDKKKVLNVLNPVTKINPIKEIKINNYYSFRNFNCNRKYKLVKYFYRWKDFAFKKLIVQKLIEYAKNKNKTNLVNNIDLKIKYKNKENNRFYRRARFNNHFI